MELMKPRSYHKEYCQQDILIELLPLIYEYFLTLFLE